MELDKKQIRQSMKQKRLSLSQQTLFSYNQSIFHKVIQHPHYLSSKTIGIYVSLPTEVETRLIIEDAFKHHRVCVPRVEGETMSFYEIQSLHELKEGHFHVEEPINNHFISPESIDLMIVPMLAYDQECYRVGYGKGFYDRYFAQGFHGYKLGLAYSFQKVNQIDKSPYDIPLDEIITE